LFAIVAVAAAALVIIVITGAVIAHRVDARISDIRQHYIPKIGLAEQLQSGFDKITRRLQDAAQASDYEILDDARAKETALLAQIDAAHEVVDPRDALAARGAVEDYYTLAEVTTRRMIRGDAGEALTKDLETMQARQARATQLLAAAGHFDPQALDAAFAAAADSEQLGSQLRLAISLACVVLVVALTLWVSRGLYRSVANLAEGLQRFGDGNFATPIEVASTTELGTVATSANQMAARLERFHEERDRNDWIRTGTVGFADELRGELEPEEVGERAIAYLARYFGAPAGAVYFADPNGVLRRLGGYGLAADTPVRFEPGEGLVGEAAKRTELTIVAAPAGALPIRSALAGGDPHTIALVPLVHSDRVTGVLELGFLAELTPAQRELLASIGESLAIAIEVARARAATRALLGETQRQAQELLEARHRLEEKAEELARASSVKSQFLANMSHELRTPLNAILGFSELLFDGAVPPDAPEHREFIGDIMKSGRHLLQLINDILDLSKVEAGKLEFHPERIQLRKTVDEVLGILRTTAASARVRVDATIDPAVDDLVIDPARLKQVLYNYLSNAIKFTPEGGSVSLRATPAERDRVCIEVEDTGIGIPADALARLFGEFQQVAVANDGKKRSGTGLGLALTKRLVEAQGGSVGVDSVVGRGSTFRAVLPKRSRRTVTPAPTLPPPTAAEAPAILVIEDDPRDQRDLVAALGAAGYAVEIAATGTQAIARCRERKFDAITLDLLLPDQTGLELLAQIRTDGINRDVPVIVITVVAERGAVAGFAVQDILSKPVKPEALVEALTRAGVTARLGEVMVIDDDPQALKLMQATLQQLGYVTRCERDGEAALRAVRSSPPSAIVLDLLMPGMSGFEFLDRLRRDPDVRRVPVIVWTGKDLSVDERAMLRASASAVVAKGVAGGGAAVVAELDAFFPSRARSN
jgi:signal transduction histidine kinase/DNA-binding response OmpR family regulator